MNKIYLCGFLIVLVTITALSLLNKSHTLSVTCYTGNHIYLKRDDKHVAFLGCTPHPTKYLKELPNHHIAILNEITLSKIIDIDDLFDSFCKTLFICKNNNVDHLIIAYLPIYFMELKQLLGKNFIQGIQQFFKNIVPSIIMLISQAKIHSRYTGNITLILPPVDQLTLIPEHFNHPATRTAYLAKQFPRIKNIDACPIETITIINNENDAESRELINYFSYTYLLKKPITYQIHAIGKKRFHKSR